MIVPLANGPLYLINNREPKVVENLVNSKDEKLSNIQGIALCRCGASKNKPFCDGSHSMSGFQSKNDNAYNDETKNKLKSKRKTYVGKNITIHDNRSICSHAAECVKNLPLVFRLNQRPWIDPDQAIIEKIIETIKKCPSGALSYSINEIEYRDLDGKPLIKVSKNGPYLVSGGIELVGEEFPDDVSKEHYTLCRCGASKNKPFCDGSHTSINFKDEKN